MATTVPGPAAGPRDPRPVEYAVLTRDDLVTGEAVALDLPAASLPLRLVGGTIDVVVTLVTFVGAAWLLTTSISGTDAALAHAAAILTIASALVFVPTAVETLTRGRSLGKLIMGIRIVRDDAGPISFQHAFVRALIGIVEIYALVGGPALLSMMLSHRGKRLGDYAAGTYAVRDRVKLALTRPPPMPPMLAGWAAAADIASLPVNLSLAVRQFLGRAPALAPHTRADLAHRLASAVSPYVAPPPPVGTPAEAFLAAVIATRRDRDLARLAREDALRARLTGSTGH